MLHDDGLLDALLCSPHLAVVGLDRDGAINLWSEGARALFGWAQDEVLGEPLTMLVPPERLPELTAMTDALGDGRDVPAVKTVRLSKHGHPVHVHLHASSLRDEEGQPVGGLAVCQDIGALGDVEQELQARFEQSPVAQSLVSLDARVLAVNEAMIELLGVEGDELAGADGLLLVHEDDREAVAAALGKVACGEQSQLRLEARLLTADGTRTATITGTPLHQRSGETVLAVAAQDVTRVRVAEEAARVQARHFDEVLTTLPVVFFSYDQQGRCTLSRGRGLDALGLQQDELVGVDLLTAYAGIPQVIDALRRTLSGEPADMTLELHGRTLTASCRPQYDAAGAIVGGSGVCIDVTEHRDAEHRIRGHEARLRSLLQYASDVVFAVDQGGSIRYVSPAVRVQLGYDERLLTGTAAAELVHPDDRSLVSAAWEAISGAPGATASCECRLRHADGSWVWTEQTFTNLLKDPVVGAVVVNIRETTERRRIDEDLRRLALQDGLTGLANRGLLLDRTHQALVRERRTESRTGLLVLDVVGMHALNQQLGQSGGDAVLRDLAQRLQSLVRPTDSLARLGSDEFAVLCVDVASTEDLLTRMATLLEVVDEAVLVDGWPVEVRLHVGSALSPAVDAGTLLAVAERGLRAAAADIDLPETEERDRSDELRSAIDGGELRLHYQPVLDLLTGDVAGCEALVRWQHPVKGLLSPADFIPEAERSGLVQPLGEWVLREACTTLAAWQREGRTWSIGVNLSPRQLVGADFTAVVRRILNETGAAADRLVLEVTESAVMDDPAAPDVLRDLRQLGIKLALDDFGTGYSSMTYLRRFAVDAIKIDRSFVAGLGRDPDDDAIVASIVSLARAVGKLVVAEGVETTGQLRALQELGVDRGQGFLWSRPLPMDDLLAWARDRPKPLAEVTRPSAPRRPDPTAVPGAIEARVLALQQEGASLHTIAAALNAEGSRTPEGPRWTTTSVARLVAGLVR